MTSPDTSSTQRYLQIFNPAPPPCTEFHQFARFPPEVRCLIWEQALCHERWINIHVRTTMGAPRSVYEIFICRPWKISKLFRITRESRRVALSFYRVKLPCWYTRDAYLSSQEEMRATLYICPELDTFQLVHTTSFEYFAYDVWAHDPLHIGVVNLATSCEERNLYLYWRLGNREKNLLKQVLLRLERFTVVNNHSPQKWLGNQPSDPTSSLSSPIHRACPLYNGSVGLERLPYDPRICDEHLQQVFMESADPRMQFHALFEVFRLLEIECAHKVDYRYAICHQPGSRDGQIGQD
ncbi:hypothetical protein FLONG3_4891 [Fusarium longipes]|uniref:2EXR domain-containing protein n=1 Tax=Fusarium longipes TaxID=694270 RepID=A0A395SWU3_9HYPO|nr:hypothetical protein FLONG3_4891 [Fusarium longipes]